MKTFDCGDHLAEGERDHQKVDAAGPQREHPGDKRDPPCRDQRDDQQDEDFLNAAFKRDGGGIGADADEGRVAEADHAAMPDD